VWEVERCANCGCADIDHQPVEIPCTEECEEEDSECEGWHVHEHDIECSCGCTDFEMLDDQFEIVCECGCAVTDHRPVPPEEVEAWAAEEALRGPEDRGPGDRDPGDWEDGDWEDEVDEPTWTNLPRIFPDGPPCTCPCGNCYVLREFGTAGERAIEMQMRRRRRGSFSTRNSLLTTTEIHSVRTRLFDPFDRFPVRASLVVERGRIRRLEGPVPVGVHVVVVLAETPDGLPLAVNWEELERQ